VTHDCRKFHGFESGDAVLLGSGERVLLFFENEEGRVPLDSIPGTAGANSPTGPLNATRRVLFLPGFRGFVEFSFFD